jgi:hypothetical protein
VVDRSNLDFGMQLTRVKHRVFSKRLRNLICGQEIAHNILPSSRYVLEYMIIAYDYENNEAVENNAEDYYVYTVIPEFPTWQMLVLTLFLIAIIVIRM